MLKVVPKLSWLQIKISQIGLMIWYLKITIIHKG